MSEELTRKTQARIAERERRQQERERRRKLVRALPFVIIGLLVVAGVSLVLYGNSQSAGIAQGKEGPRLQIDHDQIDFGDQHFNTTVRATFKITNGGDGTLVLNVPKLASVVEGC